jgi:hypothetical protein
MLSRNRQFKVKTVSRGRVDYIEGDRTMHVSVEPAYNGTIIYTRTIRAWEAPYEDVPVTDEDRQRILTNLQNDLAPWWAFWEHIHLYPDDELKPF